MSVFVFVILQVLKKYNLLLNCKEEIILYRNEGNVVKEMKLGNTKIKICDDYCRDKTKEDVEKILKDIAEIVRNNIKQ